MIIDGSCCLAGGSIIAKLDTLNPLLSTNQNGFGPPLDAQNISNRNNTKSSKILTTRLIGKPHQRNKILLED